MKSILIGFSIILLAGCASVPLTAQERAVRILRKSDPPASCGELGRITISGLTRDGMVEVEEDLKRQVAASGGNLATIEAHDQFGGVAATAYNCL